MRELITILILFSKSIIILAQNDTLYSDPILHYIEFNQCNKIKSFGSDSFGCHIYMRKNIPRINYIEQKNEDRSQTIKISFNIFGKLQSINVLNNEKEVVTEITFRNGKITRHIENDSDDIFNYYRREYIRDTIIRLFADKSIKYNTATKTKLYYTSDSNTNSPNGLRVLLNKNIEVDDILIYDRYNSYIFNLWSNGRMRNLGMNDVYDNSLKANFSNFRDALLFLEYKSLYEKEHVSIRPCGRIRFMINNNRSYRYNIFGKQK